MAGSQEFNSVLLKFKASCEPKNEKLVMSSWKRELSYVGEQRGVGTLERGGYSV